MTRVSNPYPPSMIWPLTDRCASIRSKPDPKETTFPFPDKLTVMSDAIPSPCMIVEPDPATTLVRPPRNMLDPRTTEEPPSKLSRSKFRMPAKASSSISPALLKIRVSVPKPPIRVSSEKLFG